jgi:hypothetical protein
MRVEQDKHRVPHIRRRHGRPRMAWKCLQVLQQNDVAQRFLFKSLSNGLRVQDQGHLIHQMRVANSKDNKLTRVKPTIEVPRCSTGKVSPAASRFDFASGSVIQYTPRRTAANFHGILDDHADFFDSDA